MFLVLPHHYAYYTFKNPITLIHYEQVNKVAVPNDGYIILGFMYDLIRAC